LKICNLGLVNGENFVSIIFCRLQWELDLLPEYEL